MGAGEAAFDGRTDEAAFDGRFVRKVGYIWAGQKGVRLGVELRGAVN